MQDFLLTNKTILITGASSGIGKATAILASQMGANVVIHGRDIEKLNQTFSELNINGKHQIIQADLSKVDELMDLVKQCPSLDGVVHCAGIVKPVPAKFIQPKHIEEMFSINYNAVVLINSYLLQQKKINNDASIVLISTDISESTCHAQALYLITIVPDHNW